MIESSAGNIASAQRTGNERARSLTPQSAARDAARSMSAPPGSRLSLASWAVPCLGLAALGLIDKAGLVKSSPAAFAPGVLALGVFGLAAALLVLFLARRAPILRRRGVFALCANATLLAVVLCAFVVGSWRRESALANTAQQAKGVSIAAGEHPGWYGTIELTGARLYAMEIASGSALGKQLASLFPKVLTLCAFGVDNRGGQRDLEVDVSKVMVTFADGTTRKGLDRIAVLSAALRDKEGALATHVGPYLVPVGRNLKNGLIFLSALQPLDHAVGLTFLVNRERQTLSGRYLTAQDKRAGQGRGAPPP